MSVNRKPADALGLAIQPTPIACTDKMIEWIGMRSDADVASATATAMTDRYRRLIRKAIHVTTSLQSTVGVYSSS